MLERDFCVPDILGCLVASGALPKRVMSWFNPEFWPRYKDQKTTVTTIKGGEVSMEGGATTIKGGTATIGQQAKINSPEYSFLGGVKETGESIFERRDRNQKGDTYFKEILTDSPEETNRKKCWPNDTDAYAWGHTGPGCLRIGFGFFLWETPSPFPSTISPLL